MEKNKNVKILSSNRACLSTSNELDLTSHVGKQRKSELSLLMPFNTEKNTCKWTFLKIYCMTRYITSCIYYDVKWIHTYIIPTIVSLPAEFVYRLKLS